MNLCLMASSEVYLVNGFKSNKADNKSIKHRNSTSSSNSNSPLKFDLILLILSFFSLRYDDSLLI